MTGSTVSEIWGSYHGLFEDMTEAEAEDVHYLVSESYRLGAPHLDAVEYGCAGGDELYFVWTPR